MSFAMVTLSCIVLVADRTDSYAIAGITSGALGLANVIAAPARARLVDRRGQRFGLRVLAIGYALGAIAVLVAATLSAPPVTLVLCAIAAGASAPPVGAAMRMRWRLLVTRPEDVTRAYSLDAVSEEIVYTLGPLVSGVVMALTVPETGLAASAALALAGCFLMTSTSTRPPAGAPRDAGSAKRLAVLRAGGFVPTLIVTSATGVVVGSVGVIVPAQTAPHDTLAGILLGALALGSGIGGLAYGARAWITGPRIRLILLTVAMTAACALLAAAGPVAVLGVGLVVTGLALAPAMVSGYLVADTLTDDRTRLEAHTWVNTAVNAGAAAASAVAGIVLDHSTPASAYLTGAVVAAALLTLGAVGIGPKARFKIRRRAEAADPVR
ncbi:MFS transporter [Dactylosporangium sucinum]